MKKIGISILAFSILFGYQAQEKLTNKEGSEYEFKILKELEANPFKIRIEQGLVGVSPPFHFLNRNYND